MLFLCSRQCQIFDFYLTSCVITRQFLFVCPLSLKLSFKRLEGKRGTHSPLGLSGSLYTLLFVKCKLELVKKKKSTGKQECKAAIINIYIPLLLKGKIYTIQSQKDIGQRRIAAQLSLELRMNVFITYCLHPRWGKSLKVARKWFHLHRWCMVLSQFVYISVQWACILEMSCMFVLCKMKRSCLPCK